MNWEQTIPVLSTSHLPGPHWAAKDAKFFGPIAAYEDGWFVGVPENFTPGEPAWISDLRQWVDTSAYSESRWLRFDSCGDFVEGLHDFGYVWEVMEKTS